MTTSTLSPVPTGRTDKLGLDPAMVRRARELAAQAGRPVVELANSHTTVAVERATLRLAGLGGAAIGAVWNYAMSSVFVWRSRTAAAPARQAQAQITSADRSSAGRNSLSPSAA